MITRANVIAIQEDSIEDLEMAPHDIQADRKVLCALKQKGLLQWPNQNDVLASRPTTVVGLVEPGRKRSQRYHFI